MSMNKKGFTLIEVLVSIALLGIIAVSFLPPIASSLKWLVDTKTTITQKAFEQQQDMETSIQEIIKAMNSGEINSSVYSSLEITDKIQVKLFESNFSSYDASRNYPSAYKVEILDGDNKKFIALVGDKRLPELPVPVIETVNRVFIRDGAESSITHEYSNYANLKIIAKSNMTENPSNSFNRYRSDWYVSKPGFNIPLQNISNIDEDNDFGRIYPSFPNDYISAPVHSEIGSAYSFVNVAQRNISVELRNDIINKYYGRHILYTITPFAKSLKMGSTSYLLPLYLYGPKMTTNLSLHFDASTIDMSDIYNSSLNTNGTLVIEGGNHNVKNWKSSRPSVKNPTLNQSAIQKTKDNMPILLKNDDLTDSYTGHAIPFQEGEVSTRVWSRALGNKSTTMSNMKVSEIDLGINLNLFIILRKTDTPLAPQINTSIIKGNSATGSRLWSLDWVGEPSNPRLSLLDGSNRTDLASTLNLGEWYLVQVSTQSNLLLEASSLKRDSTHNLSANGIKALKSNTKTIDINWNGVEIAEILVYNSSLSSSELDSIRSYLIYKYNPDF